MRATALFTNYSHHPLSPSASAASFAAIYELRHLPSLVLSLLAGPPSNSVLSEPPQGSLSEICRLHPSGTPGSLISPSPTLPTRPRAISNLPGFSQDLDHVREICIALFSPPSRANERHPCFPDPDAFFRKFRSRTRDLNYSLKFLPPQQYGLYRIRRNLFYHTLRFGLYVYGGKLDDKKTKRMKVTKQQRVVRVFTPQFRKRERRKRTIPVRPDRARGP